jgi:FkbM family methyltransferase
MEKRIKCKHGWFNYYTNDICIGRSLEHYGEYCEPEIDLIKQFTNKDSIVLDVGANIGTHAVPLSKHVNTVHAFEACVENYAMLCKNSPGSLNYNCAVTNHDDRVHVKHLNLLQEGNYGKVSTSKYFNGNTPAITIDSLELPQVDFIKIDVEGGEKGVLQGAYYTLRMHNPHMLIEAQDERNYKIIYRLLKEHDYNIYWFPVATYNSANYRENQINIFGEQHGVLNWVVTKQKKDLELVRNENDTIEKATARQANS